ncbi:MAG: ADP-ribosylglycohydrolase family protein [Chloroflexota bacterium]
MRTGFIILSLGLSFVLVGCNGRDVPSRLTDRLAYQNRLQGMWLGATIANWTGLITERARQEAPFYTDDDWNTLQTAVTEWQEDQIIDFVFQDPWLADDDTDIEYIYLHLMTQHQTPYLTGAQIAEGWQTHINRNIWVSNASARDLMHHHAKPPVTSLLAVNPNALMIDAQLTTEFFGALAPGLPERALELADLPIRTTATGYAAHAAQFYVVLYALASQVDTAMPPEEQVVWLVQEARKYLPDSSKTADIVDFVVADFENNPDRNEWERTRDLVYKRYQLDAVENGFVYRDWVESSVNFATGIIALLYGGGNYKRTVQIGTLSGWDSDNGTSTMGGLLGLMLGHDGLVAQFPEQNMSDRYHVWRTRDGLPDYLTDDAQAEDTFALMAERMIPLVERVILDAGGSVNDGTWTLPERANANVALNPTHQLYLASNNNQVVLAGGSVTAVSGTTSGNTSAVVDGHEFNFSGQEVFDLPTSFEVKEMETAVFLEITYSHIVPISTIQSVEGAGGGFEHVDIELLIEDEWVPAILNMDQSSELDAHMGYQLLEFVLNEPQQALGFRLIGTIPENSSGFHLLEIDSFR